MTLRKPYHCNISSQKPTILFIIHQYSAYLDKVHPADLASAISKHVFYKDLDYYITANTFAMNYGRSQSNLFALTNIVIDIDMHNIDNSKETDVSDEIKNFLKNDNLHDDLRFRLHRTSELCQDLLWRLQRDLFSKFPPNVVHMTGRGIIVLETTSEKQNTNRASFPKLH